MAVAAVTFPRFVGEVVEQLRRRGLPLGIGDCRALREALAAGFGWSCDEHLRDLCVALWATSREEAEVIRAVFARVDVPLWSISDSPREGRDETAIDGGTVAGVDAAPELVSDPQPEPETMRFDVQASPRASSRPADTPPTGLPALPAGTAHDPTLIFLPRYPMTDREIAQVLRRLRRPRRGGAAVELDPAETLRRFACTGVATPPVLVPSRRNTAGLTILLDRQGSMAPFHDFADHIVSAIGRAGRLDTLTVRYFRNTAGRSDQYRLLDQLPDPFAAALDPVVDAIEPPRTGRVYRDPGLTEPVPLATVTAELTPATGVVIISDAGAARGGLNIPRLFDTIALLKAVRGAVWLNPVRPDRWRATTAGQVARHIPMFPLTRAGMHLAVDALRGRPFPVERPL